MKSGNLNFLEPSGPLRACNGTDLPLPFTLIQFVTSENNNLHGHRDTCLISQKVIRISLQRPVATATAVYNKLNDVQLHPPPPSKKMRFSDMNMFRGEAMLLVSPKLCQPISLQKVPQKPFNASRRPTCHSSQHRRQNCGGGGGKDGPK